MTRRELAQAMRRGIATPDVEEWREGFIKVQPRNCWVCALGSALVGKNGGDYRKAEQVFKKLFEEIKDPKGGEKTIARLLDIPVDLAIEISGLHFNLSESIEQIAQWLESSTEEETEDVNV